MATLDFVPIPAQAPATVIAGLATSTSSVEQALGKNVIFNVNSDQDITIRFGQAGFSGSAGTTDFRLPANSTHRFDTGNIFTSVKFYNLGSLPANIYLMFISKF